MSSPASHAAAELQNLALQLLALPSPRAVLITSAHEGEGKTFVATALARRAAAASQERVLLVDANFERPALEKHFGCEGAQGFSDAIAAGTATPTVLCSTELPNLRVMSAGTCRSPTLMFQPMAIRAVLADLCVRNDLVILDGGTTQAAGALAQCATAVLLVADSQDTRREAAAGALARLKVPRERILGAVLNRKRRDIPEAVYARL